MHSVVFIDIEPFEFYVLHSVVSVIVYYPSTAVSVTVVTEHSYSGC